MSQANRPDQDRMWIAVLVVCSVLGFILFELAYAALSSRSCP